MTTKSASIGLKQLLILALGGVGLLACPGCACGEKKMSLTRDEYINSEMYIDRPVADRTGAPLEVNVVLVYPDDLKKDVNSQLKPGSGITSKEWFEKRPKAAADPARFDLPRSQILLFTNDSDYYGERKGPALQGTKVASPDPALLTFKFERGLNDENAVIYVFGRFTDKDGYLLPVPPAMFQAPGKYPDELSVHIGVDWNRSGIHQYIVSRTNRK